MLVTVYGEARKTMSSETVRNSGVEVTIRPETLMEELGVKKSVYYEDIKFLGLELSKDDNGKVFLKEDEANLVRSLRSHVQKTGKRNGFDVEKRGELGSAMPSAIATTESSSMNSEFHTPEQQQDPCAGIDQEALYREASEVAACQMTMPQQVVLAMASQLTYDDLHPEAKAKVDSVRQAVAPKFQPQQIAAQLLEKIRQQRSEVETAAA